MIGDELGSVKVTRPDGSSRRDALSRRTFIAGSAATIVGLANGPTVLAATDKGPHSSIRSMSPDIATSWIRTLYDVVMVEGLTPPAAARFYHYAATSMYETAVPHMPGFRSLAGQLAGLGRARRAPGHVDMPIAISVAVSTVALGLLPKAQTVSTTKIDERHQAILTHRSAAVGNERIVSRSVEYGEREASRLLEWMNADGYAEASTTPYTPPIGPDKWRSTPPNFGTAIEPYWHLVRPAILTSADEVEPLAPTPFSTEPGSAFHEQAMITYRQSSANTAEQIAIARFWTDNPRLSGLPSGHWFLLLAQLSDETLGIGLDQTLEGFARLGVALHDAFLNCWTWKYRYNLIRPVTYIRDHVDANWVTLVNTPQFPEYTSGHSVSSGAADVVLTSMFGRFPFIDTTAVGRGLGERAFTSFTHAADEAATSRIYGGIHYPMGIDNGLTQGRAIGQLIDARLHTRRRHR